jgi:hypothetical protein
VKKTTLIMTQGRGAKGQRWSGIGLTESDKLDGLSQES